MDGRSAARPDRPAERPIHQEPDAASGGVFNPNRINGLRLERLKSCGPATPSHLRSRGSLRRTKVLVPETQTREQRLRSHSCFLRFEVVPRVGLTRSRSGLRPKPPVCPSPLRSVEPDGFSPHPNARAESPSLPRSKPTSPKDGAQGGTRTHTSLRTADFKSAASTDSATRAIAKAEMQQTCSRITSLRFRIT